VAGVAEEAWIPPAPYVLEPSGTAEDRAARARFVAWSSDEASGLEAPLLASELTARPASPPPAVAAGSVDWGVGFGATAGVGDSTALGNEPVDARGHLLGSEYGDAYGSGGMGLIGTETGGGGSMGLTGRGGRAPELRLGDATTYGGLSKEAIRRVVRQHQPKLRLCYTTALETNPEASGRVTVRFTIGPDGTVIRAAVTANSTADEALARCLNAVVSGMTFPEADTAIEVTYPFVFQPEDEELVVVARDATAVSATPASPPPAPTQGALRARNGAGEWVGEFPLEHTEVAAEIGGFVARTEVAQRYGNPYDESIEAVYAFPLPALGAVHEFVMEVGGRTIVGVVRERAEAERIYAEARAQGLTASLLSEERPNIFTQSVANIEPGGEVTIRLTFFERLTAERGEYEWVFPMVVGPRYIAGETPTAPDPGGGAGIPGAPPGGGGTSPATERVPDADRITPPVLRPGERSGHDIGLTVKLDAGLPVRELKTINHAVEVEEPSASVRLVKLAEQDAIANRDFVLRWSTAGEETEYGVLAHRGDDGGFVTLMLRPPAAPTDTQVMPRELTFILDVSGSMMGEPLAIGTDLVARSLATLRPDDLFNVVYFADGNAQLFDAPQARTPENLEAARRFLAVVEGGGGTEMIAGLERALAAEHDPRRLQMFVLLTDGYVAEDRQVVELVRSQRGAARFFAFGIGSSVNRMLIDGVGEHGGGFAQVVLPREGEEGRARTVQALFDRIDSPVLVDVRIDWNGLPVAEAYPARLPDLFAGQTIDVVARYTAAARGTIYVEARCGAETLRVPVEVELPEREEANAALAPIWARWRIEERMDEWSEAEADDRAALEQEIVELATEYRLVSRFTSFVAVDESRVVGDGAPLRVMQPVELPEGVSFEGAVGEVPVGSAVEVPSWGLLLQSTSAHRVRVAVVRAQGEAAARGVQAGAVVTAVDGTLVHDLRHVEGLLLQGANTVRLTLEPGGEVELPGPGA
jgi:Ca-activated chloride channel family protein